MEDTGSHRSVSDGLIPRQPGYAVEVLIGTGELGQAIRLHHRHDQGIVVEKSHLPAEHRPRRDQWDRDRQHLDAALQDSLNRLLEARELLHQGGMLPEPPCDSRHRLREGANRFNRHDPLGHLGQDVRGGETPDFLVLDALEELTASSAVLRVRDEVVNEWIRIQEDCLSGAQVGEGQGCSSWKEPEHAL